MANRTTKPIPLLVIEASEGLIRNVYGPPDLEFDTIEWDWDEVCEVPYETLRDEYWPRLQRMDDETEFHFIEQFLEELERTYDDVETEREPQQEYWKFIGVVEDRYAYLQKTVEGPVANE